MFVTPARLVRALGQWPVTSQQAARRNALIACTALAERRRQFLEVEEFLASRTLPEAGPATPVDVSAVTGRTGGE